MDEVKLKCILEAALLAASRPLSIDDMLGLFPADGQPERAELRAALSALEQDCAGRGIELKQVSSGHRFQVRSDYSEWVSRLWEERPPRYSRALLETLALVAYRQPITRAEIEDVRGVSVSTTIMKTLLERNWVRVVGHRDVPGRPALYATTKEFLDYFNLKSLDELPTLAELRDFDSINAELEPMLPLDTEAGAGEAEASGEALEPEASTAQSQEAEEASTHSHLVAES